MTTMATSSRSRRREQQTRLGLRLAATAGLLLACGFATLASAFFVAPPATVGQPHRQHRGYVFVACMHGYPPAHTYVRIYANRPPC